MENTFSIEEVASKLNISSKTLRRWEETGRFTASRTIGNQRRYTTEDIQILDAIKSNIIPSRSELVTASEASTLLGISQETLTRWQNSGKLFPFPTLSQSLYQKSQLLQTSHAEPIIKEEFTSNQVSSNTSTVPTLTPFNPSLASDSVAVTKTTNSFVTGLLTHTLVSVILILFYHFLTTTISPSVDNKPEVVQPQVTDPAVTKIKNLFDTFGNFTTAGAVSTKLTTSTPVLILTPTSNPKAVAGTLYFDPVSTNLRFFNGTSWIDLNPSPITTPSATIPDKPKLSPPLIR